MMQKRRFIATLILLAVLLTGLFFLHLATGFHYFTKAHLIAVLLGGGTPEEVLTVFDFRMVRSILAVLIGMGLAVSGADYTARIIIAPDEMLVGLVVSLIGAPYFLYILLRSKG